MKSNRMVKLLGKRAANREAKLKAASVLQNLIMDGEFYESAKPLIWSFIDKLRAQRGKRHNARGCKDMTGMKNDDKASMEKFRANCDEIIHAIDE